MSESVPSRAERDRLAEARRLLEPNPRLGVPVPAYGGRSLPNIAASLWATLGRDGGEAPPLPPLDPAVDPFRGTRPEGPVVVLLVDGLGWSALLGSAKRNLGGAASRWTRWARPLTSVFPTTTTVALTSLSTGAAPGQHGVVGHRVYLPHFGTVVELLRMSPLGVSVAEALVGPEWSPSTVSGVPSVFRRGVSGVALSRDRFKGSGFTRLIYDGASFVPFITGSDLAISLAEVLSRPDPPDVVYAYWEDLDVAQHVRGPLPTLVDLEVDRVDAVLSSVTRHLEPGLARRTTILLTGDHGQVPMDADQQLVADRDEVLLSHLVHPPAGDRRATYFAARPGRLPQLRATLEERVRPLGRLLEMPDAVEAGLFGPPTLHSELSERLGDLLVLMPSPGGVSYTVPDGRPRSHPMRGAHGGLEPEELLVPFIAGTLSELFADRTRTAHLGGTPFPADGT